MDLELKGKVAIVGGGSKGLGRACADVLAEEGAAVAVCSRNREDLERAAQSIREGTGGEAPPLAGDPDRAATGRPLAPATGGRWGGLDIRANTPGGPPLARALSATEEQWATAVQRSLVFFARM